MEESKVIITEEDLVFTPEQLQQLGNLRLQRVQEAFDKEEDVKLLAFIKENYLNVGDPIFVVLEGVEFYGFIKDITNNEQGKPISYVAVTPHGILSDLTYNNIKKRHVEDLTGVVIPDELKSMTTRQLLRQLSYVRKLEYSTYDDYFRGSYSTRQFKAELATRPHITNKRERQAINKLKKANKK